MFFGAILASVGGCEEDGGGVKRLLAGGTAGESASDAVFTG